jgi:hypothetical protein
MVSNSARKSVRDEGCLIVDTPAGRVGAIGLALYVGPDADDAELLAAAANQLGHATARRRSAQ